MYRKLLSLSGISLGGLLLATNLAVANELEVLHWWTSGGEARSAELLKEVMESKGYTWKDFAVAGGGGESAMMVLKARAVSGNPPTAAQIKGYDIQEWAQLGFLTNVEDVAIAEHWDNVLPKSVADIMKFKGKYVAVPINLHRVNWLWANPDVFAEVGVSIPTTLEEFFTVAEKIKAAGYIPLAHGGQPWQDTTLFEAIALAVLGAEDYRKAFVDLDMDTLSGEKMVEVFSRFHQLRNYIDKASFGRTWNAATDMVIEGKAAMQLMGDWVKGVVYCGRKSTGEDYLCVPAPGTVDMFSYNIDSFVFFKHYNKLAKEGKAQLAQTIMSKPFQEAFNFNKGSLPARADISLDRFDQCSVASMEAFRQSEGSQNLLPSLSANMSTTSFVRDAIFSVVSDFFNDADADPKKAPDRLARAIKAAM